MRAYAYDDLDRLASDGDVAYTYDAAGSRMMRTEDGETITYTLEGTTRHVYDDNWQVIADIDENGNLLVSYVWGEGIDKLLAVAIGGTTYYPLTDVQGTVWGYVDSQNNIVARWEYDAWGNVLSEEIDSSAALARLRYRFQGREWSAATGLINFRMRWYDAETGRWLSKDPIGLSGGLNLYAFCKNAPILYADVLGLCDDESSWLDKFWENYHDIDQDWSDFFHLDASDSLGYVGISAALTAIGTSVLGDIAIAAAESQITAGELAGALCNGSIVRKIAVASDGAKSAARAAAGKMGLGLASKASLVVGASATVWSIAIRAGFALAAAHETIFGR